MSIHFKLQKKDENARIGQLSVAHGDIRTPAFMLVGTAMSSRSNAVTRIKEYLYLRRLYHRYYSRGNFAEGRFHEH